MSKIVVCGVAGRMGQRLADLTLAAEDLELCGGKEHPAHEAIGRDIGEVIGTGRLDLAVSDTLAGIVEPDRVVTVIGASSRWSSRLSNRPARSAGQKFASVQRARAMSTALPAAPTIAAIAPPAEMPAM